MPALVVSETMGSEEPKELKKKMKKSEKGSSADTLKKSKKTKIDSGSDSEELKKSKKKDKKRKYLNLDDEEDDDSSEILEPSNLNGDDKKEKAKLVENDDDEEKKEEKEEDPNALSNFRISVPLREALIAKGIQALFPIQAMTFDTIFDGNDLVGRARTGQVCNTLCYYLSEIKILNFYYYFFVFS